MAFLIKRARNIWANLAALSRGPIRYAYLGDHTAIASTRGNSLVLLDTRDRAFTPHLALAGHWESDVERALVRLLKRGQRIVEVGANMGYHTLTMARAIGRTGRIDAFEPNPRMV